MFRSLIIGIASFLLGGVLVIVALVLWMTSKRPSEEEIRKKYVVEYSAEAQQNAHVDCRSVKGRLGEFLESRLRPALSGPGMSDADASKLRALEPELAQYSSALRLCEQLYLIGRNGTWNGLGDLGYAGELQVDFIRMDTILKYSLSSPKCRQECRKSALADLKKAHDDIVRKLK